MSNRKEYIPYTKEVNVYEHKAPTDESVSLLNELTEKAKANIIKVINIEENHLKCVIIYFADSYSSNKLHVNMKFELNGKTYTFTDTFNDKNIEAIELNYSYFRLGDEEIFKTVHKHFSDAIAMELMKQSPEFMKHIMKK